MSVMIVTSLGDIVIDLHTDRCPLTTKNFLKLCKIKYYNGCLFHTVQKDFTAQTGDPTGKGSGGDSIYKFLYGDQARFFNDEIHPDLKHLKTGTVAMASAGENLNASQFYFTLRDDLDYLDGKHTVFGEVAEGLDTLTRINEAYVDQKERPYKNIRIKHTYILDDPFDDPPTLVDFIPGASPEGKPKDEIDDDVRLEDDWVPLDEQLGPSELEEMLRAKDAHSSAVVLESIGDIPEAEIKPPENVLFVCKLNPVTEDEDLNTIFSRFGTVVSADIIRDYKTGDSLCYAFIEFETVEACEQAYFKMDNALIDDRRIHVDFSQSVAKLWSQYRRKDNQATKGKGCFKCGALDHIARDCSGGPSSTNQAPRYTLKEDNIQSGGNGNSRYEMVFDEDTELSPEQGKKQLKHEPEEKREKQRPERRSTEVMKERDREKRESKDRHKHDGARRGYSREDTRDDEDRFRRDSNGNVVNSHVRRHGGNSRDEYQRDRRDEKYYGGRGRDEYQQDRRGERDHRGSSRDEYQRDRREEKDYKRDEKDHKREEKDRGSSRDEYQRDKREERDHKRDEKDFKRDEKDHGSSRDEYQRDKSEERDHKRDEKNYKRDETDRGSSRDEYQRDKREERDHKRDEKNYKRDETDRGSNRDKYQREKREEQDYKRGEKGHRGSSRDEYQRDKREEKNYKRDTHGDSPRDAGKELVSRKRSERSSDYDDRSYRDEKRR